MQKPVIFIGNKEHARIRAIACKRAGIPFSHMEVQWWRPNDAIIAILKRLKRIKASIVIVQSFENLLPNFADILTFDSKHFFIRYDDKEMSEEVLAHLAKLPRTIYINAKSSNEDFARLLSLCSNAESYEFNASVKRLISEGFIKTMKLDTSNAKEVLLYYHKTMQGSLGYIGTKFDDHQKKFLRTEDLDSISNMIFHKSSEPLIPQHIAFYATQMALRAISCETKTPYKEVFAKLLKIDTEVLDYWNKWIVFGNVHSGHEARVDGYNHNLLWPAKERLTNGCFHEEFWVFGIHIESVTWSDKVERTTNFGLPPFEELTKNKTEPQIAGAILTHLIDTNQLDEFLSCIKTVAKKLGNTAVVKRFQKAAKSLEAAKFLTETPEL